MNALIGIKVPRLHVLRFAAAFLMGFVAFAWQQGRSGRSINVPYTRRDLDTTRYTPRFVAAHGRELSVVYIGKLNCAASSGAPVARDVRAILVQADLEARRRGVGFSSVGVALDWGTREGLEHLDHVAAFDEVHAGRNWMHSYFVRDIEPSLTVEPATPTLILVEQVLTVPTISVPNRARTISAARVLAVARGVDEIHSWVKSPPWVHPASIIADRR